MSHLVTARLGIPPHQPDPRAVNLLLGPLFPSLKDLRLAPGSVANDTRCFPAQRVSCDINCCRPAVHAHLSAGCVSRLVWSLGGFPLQLCLEPMIPLSWGLGLIVPGATTVSSFF